MFKNRLAPLCLFAAIIFFGLQCDEENSPTLFDMNIGITPDGAGSVIPSQDLSLLENETIQILAQPSNAYVFAGWSGTITSNDNPLTITVTEDLDLTANFLIKNYPLTTTIEGRGEVVETILTAKTDYDHGTTVQLMAMPENSWVFTGWSGDINSTEETIEVLVTSEVNVTATFEFEVQDPVPVAKTNDTKIYMHYMPWFTSGPFDGSWGYHWTLLNRNPDNIVDGRRDIASHYYPLIGPYSSQDPDVAEYHLLLMKYAGVDAVLIDWYGTYDLNDYADNLAGSENLIDKIDEVGLQFGIVYEDRVTQEAVDAGRASTLIEAATTDFLYMENNYFNTPEYLTVDGNPLALAWTPIEIESPQAWGQILGNVNQDLLYLALWYQGGDLGEFGDGEYAWVFGGNGNHINELTSFYNNRARGLDVVIGSSYPGFVDFYQEGGVGNIIGWEIPHNGTATLDATLAEATRANVQHLQLVTFNDFGEGTMFEPTIEFGYDFLTTIQEYTGVSYSQTELELIFDLYQLRKEFLGDAEKQDQLNQVFSYLVSLQVDEAATIINSLKSD